MRAVATVGETIDGFTLIGKLHAGGMATIWRVEHEVHPGPLVMKLPLILDGDDPGMIVSFEVEDMILQRLSGRHAPRFIASSGLTQRPYLVMEQIRGRSLEEMSAAGPLPAEEVARIGAAVATALHDLHRQHVTHLDVKPGNILMTEDGTAVLIDFGLSRHDQLPDLLAEETRLPIGTGAFIAPEQLVGVRGDLRSDIFATGAVLYRLLTGRLPFGDVEGRAMRRRLWRDPVPPTAIVKDCPPALQEIILRCLEVDAARRHQTAAQLAYDLRHLDSVALTSRATRTTRDGFGTVLRRRLAAGTFRPSLPPSTPVAGRLSSAPLIAVAVDLAEGQAPLAEALRGAVRRQLQLEPDARLTCVNVLKVSRLGIEQMVDEEGHSLHMQRLIELRHWSESLGVPDERVTHHVLEAPDPADALIAHAKRNNVDHVIMGARAASPYRRYLGSVSARVVAETPCSITIIRLRNPDDHLEDGPLH
jgi:nucleotide-binding universal stress UspA family protein